MLAFAMFAKAEDGSHWPFNINAENTMTCTAVLYIDGVSMQNDANAQYYEIGAFIDDECVSSYLADAFPPFVGGYGYNFMFHTNATSGTITFRVYNHNTDQELECTHNCSTTLTFVKDGNEGNLLNPLHIELVADPTIVCYDINATANPTAGGTVSGAGTFKPGRTCNLTATANTGYDFVNWTKESTAVSTDATYSFTVSEDADYVANFQIKTYAITATADPTDGGTVTGAGTYDYGTTCTLTATPTTGYQFVNWTKGGVEVSTNASYSFTATDGVEGAYVAHFSMEPYVITASANPVEGGTVDVDGPLTHGSTCTLTATPNAHYDFVNWTLAGEVVSTDAEYSFTVTGDAAYVANFELESYEITATVNPAGAGTVDGAGFITYGQTCTLTATANGGYEFANWTLGGVEVSTDDSYTFTVYEAGEYVANFTPKTYYVTVAANPTEGGFVSRKPEPTVGDIYDYGQQVKLRAVPKLGYEFVNWTKSNAKKKLQAKDGGETLVYTLDGTETGGSNGYAEASDITQNGIDWVVYGNTTMNPWRIGGKNLSGVDRPVYSTGTISDNVSKIVVTHGTINGVTVNSMTLIVSANSDFSNPTSTLTGDYEASTTNTFNRPDGVDWTNKYYKLVYNVSVSGSSNKYLQFVSAEFYKDNNGGGVTPPTPINMDEPEITITVNDDNSGAYTANFQTVELPVVPTQTHWTSVDGLLYTMNITGIMVLDGESMKNNDVAQYLEIGAFVGDECRGSFLPTTYNLPFAQGYFYEMTVNGNNSGEQVVFRVWNHINNEELDVTSLSNTTFIADANLGDLMTPHELEFETNLIAHYNIVATANIPEAGTVTGSGSYEEDTECTLVATANEHYNFVNWTKGDEVVSTNATYAFTVTANGTYVANFEPMQYEITVADPQHGTVEGAGTYAYNTQCVLTATPDEGYHFVNWTKGGVEVSTEASYAFVVEADANYTATFAINTYDIVVTVSPYLGEENSCGSVTGAGNFEHFATCTLTATPATKWVFENWTENEVVILDEAGDPVGAEYTFTVTGPRNIVANFAPIYTITASVDKDIEVAGVEPGTIEGAGDVIKGQIWTLTETPDAGYTFATWYEVIGDERVPYSTEATISEEAQADREFVAYFTLNSYDITATVNPDEVPATATEITVAGTVAGTGSYHHYDECTLTATPETGYHFVNWTETIAEETVVVATEAEYTFTVDGSRDLVANFELDTHEITATVADVTTDIPEAAPEVPGTVTGTGTYNYYDMCTMVATPEVGYHFVNWTENDVEVATTETYEFMVTADRALVANFELDTHDITVTIVDVTIDKPAAAPDVPGTVTGDATYNYYATCTMVATPEVGYHFVNWTENDVEVSTDATYEFMVTEDRALVANFELDTHTIALSVADVTAVIPEAAPAVPGTVTGDGTYNYYAMCTVVATPEVGYHFVNWTEGGTEVATTETYEFMVEGDRELVANFELDTHDITVTVVDVTVDKPEAAPAIPGTVTGADTYNYYATCTLVATPATGYHFVNWTENGVEVETATTLEFMVTEDRDLVANFELDTHTITATVADVTVDKPEAAPAVPGEVTGYVWDDNNQVVLNYYEICTLTAVPATGYHFVNWTENGEEVKDEMGNPVGYEYIFMVTEDRNLVANFELDTHVITTSVADVSDVTPAAAPAVPGTVTGAGTFNYYAMCTLVATPAEGYAFVNWTENGSPVLEATTNEYTFMVTEDRALVANFQLITKTVTASVNDLTVNKPEAAPEIPGEVTGAGTYNYYTACTMVATPATGYHFVNWTEGGNVVSTSATYEFILTADRVLVANFELDTHEITVTLVDVTDETPAAAPAEPGTVTGAGTYNYYATCTLVATPATGYHFVNWTENDVEVATTTTLEFMVTADRALVANFELDAHEITATVADVTENIPAAAPAVPGTVTGAGNYNYYATCTMEATPEVGYHFVNWTENGVEVATTATYEFMVTADRALVANFELDAYEIVAEINPAETPDNDPDPAGVVTGAGTYNHYATCELTATANTGYDFVNWTLNGNVVSTEATFSFEVDGSYTYVANFQIKSYTLTVTVLPDSTPVADPSVAGTVTIEGYVFDDNHQVVLDHFTTCTLTAIPSVGYHFVNWTDEYGNEIEGLAATEPVYSFMVEEDRQLVANFALNEYTISATADAPEIPSSGPSVPGTISGTGVYNHYATCTLTATPSEGYHFVNWTENGEVIPEATVNTYTFTVTGDRSVVANFALNEYTVEATANPTGFGTIEGAGTYKHYATCTLVATAGEDHTFFNWTENDVEVSTNATYSFTVTGPRTLVAHFINRYAITVAANPTVGGTVTGGAIYDEGTSVTLTATPATGYHFVNWTLNGNEVSTNATYTFTAQAAGDYVANFEINNYAITAVANPTAGGTVTGAGNYDHFTTCTLTATPATGYHFLNWTKNGTVVTTNTSYSFTVEAAADFVANFELNSYEITATLDPANAGTVTGAGTYNHFATCMLTANPSSSYLFVNWTKNGQVVSTEPTISFTVEGPAAYVAHFIPNTYVITASASPAYAGTVSGAGTYYYLTEHTLTATPNNGFHFVNWTKNGQVVSTEASFTITVTQDETYVANFESNVYQVTAFANPAEGGSVSGAGVYTYGQTCVLEATPNEGYHFVNWTDANDQVVSTSIAYLFNVYENVAFVANFELDSFTITAVANPAEGGVVTGDGTYNYGASCTLTATVANGYNFINWTKGNEIVSTDASFTFTVTEDADYVANFEEIIIPTYEVTVTASPENYGTVEGGGVYEEGETCTITATPSTGHIFVHWTENGEVVSENAEYSFLVTADHDFVAVFDVDGVGEYSNLVFNIYPNPATEKVVVESNEFIRRCEVYSVNGALMVTMYECTETFEINVSEYAPGSYVIRLTSDKSVQTRSFVKTK